MSYFKDQWKNRKKKGVRVSISVDIRKVENFFKRLFGKKKKEKNNEKERKNKTD